MNYSRNITLRSTPAVEALAGFVEHRTANPDKVLLFCYLTTARIGAEKSSPIPQGTAGIQAWERLRLGQVDALHEKSLLEGLRTL